MRTAILGVPVDAVTGEQALARIKESFQGGTAPFFVVTPNPEFVVLAQKDKGFMESLVAADLAVADGIGLVFASRFLGQPLPERVAGSDLTVEICRWAAEAGKSVYLLGGEPGAAEASAERLTAAFPGLKIAGAERGGRFFRDGDGEWRLEGGVAERVAAARPDILLAGLVFGGQEIWLQRMLREIPGIGLAMGVGGTFDFLGGRVRRAPNWMRRLGLEWLYRLFGQPRRWRRIFRAVFVFPALILRARIATLKSYE